VKRTVLLALLLGLGALVLAACGSSSDPNVGSTAIAESPAEAVQGEGGGEAEAMGGEATEGEPTGEGAEEGTGEGAGTAEEEAEPGSKGSIVPNEGETEGVQAGQKPGGDEGEQLQEGGKATLAAGKAEFETNCGTCHTLAEAGTSGEVGPNLDELMPELALVEKQVTEGGGGMPAFQGVLTGEEIAAVAAYVSKVAGTEG
jgi:mono/diheme cytochrome c family protein